MGGWGAAIKGGENRENVMEAGSGLFRMRECEGKVWGWGGLYLTVTLPTHYDWDIVTGMATMTSDLWNSMTGALRGLHMCGCLAGQSPRTRTKMH